MTWTQASQLSPSRLRFTCSDASCSLINSIDLISFFFADQVSPASRVKGFQKWSQTHTLREWKTNATNEFMVGRGTSTLHFNERPIGIRNEHHDWRFHDIDTGNPINKFGEDLFPILSHCKSTFISLMV